MYLRPIAPHFALSFVLVACAQSSWLDPRDESRDSTHYALHGVVAPAFDGVIFLQAEAVNIGRHMAAARTPIMSDGSFELMNLEKGSYEIRIINTRGEIVSRLFASVPAFSELRFELHSTVAPPQPPISYYRLAHRIPGKARKAWKAAARAASENQPQLAVEHLEAALLADPEFADALHMRGLFALTAGDLKLALVYLTKAASLDNANPGFLADAAVAQYAAENFPEANRLARAALRIDPNHQRASLVLARSRK